jgi:integrase
VKAAGDLWLESCDGAGLERTTLDQYRQHLNLHIDPFLGRTRLADLSVPGIRCFQDKLRTEGRSAAMVKRVMVSLGSLIADAQERGLVARNAVREMAKSRSRKAAQGERRQKARLQVGVDIPTPAEIAAMLRVATGRWRPFFITAVFTGMRASELRGLRWQDVDLKAARLHVRQRADRYQEVGMPKSGSGQRTMMLPPMAVNALKEWKLACPKGDLGLVFPNGEGNIEWHPNIVERGFKPMQVAAGVVVPTGDTNDDGRPILMAKYSGLHALRHFHASWCINPPERGGLGMSPKEVQTRLGHSSITMTMDTYGHLFPETDDGTAMAAAEQKLLAAVHAT